MGTLHRVPAVELAAGIAAAAALASLIVRRALLRRRALPAAIVRLAQAIPDALGDAALAIDRAGRVVFANSAAARLAGSSVAELVDRDVAAVAPELGALARGLERGPATARFVLRGPRGPIRVQAALVRVLARPPIAFAVMRALPQPPPPPPPRPPSAPARVDPADRGEPRAVLAAAAGALREPIAEAVDAIALLRLAVTRLEPAADAALGAAEAAVEGAARKVAEIDAAAAQCGPPRPLDLAALVEELVATFPAPPGVKLLFELAASRALADDRPVRAALRELLGAAAASLPRGGEIAVAVRDADGRAAFEIHTSARIAAGGLALARALVAPQGGRVEEGPAPDRGWVVRVALEGAAALEPA